MNGEMNTLRILDEGMKKERTKRIEGVGVGAT